jgi:PAS domain S-box-containing protein
MSPAGRSETTAFVESLIEGLPNPVFVKDEQHRWVLLNAACCRFMGRSREELIGKSDFDFFPPEEARVFWAKDDEVFASGAMNENEEAFTDSAGCTHVIITRKTVLQNAQGRRFLLGVITDITALREASEELRASRDLLEERVRQRTAELSEANAHLREQQAHRAAFMDMLGHELRNPLSAIQTSSTLLRRAPAGSPAAVRAREVVERQLRHLTRLCDDLLDAARLAHGKLDLHRRPLDLVPAVRTICEDHRPQFDARGIALAFEACAEALWVEADETRVAQAVGNLLHNALKFTPPGGQVEVTVRCGGSVAEVMIRDNGLGMPPAEVERMFEPFAQGQGADARARGGLGLGLALTKGLAEAHGGTVTARSEGPGLGLVVVFALPTAADCSRAVRPAASTSPRRRLSVVVIEDNADVRDSLSDLLRLEGYRVHAAADGHSGVDVVKAVHPDVVLCDLGLPDVAGDEVARELRSDPELKACVLVALSGFAQPEDVRRAREAGFDEHLPKPPSLERLNEVLARAGG